MCGHPAPGTRHLGKVTLPLAKVGLPPSRSAGQYQQGWEWGREPLARPGRRLVELSASVAALLLSMGFLQIIRGVGILGLCP